MNFSIIQKLQLEGAKRLDAEYYQPEYLRNDELLSKFEINKIGEIADVVFGTTPKGASFIENGVPFIRSQNFENSLINFPEIVYCSNDFHKNNLKSEVKPGDILFAAVGATIGELAIIQPSLTQGNINQNIGKIRITDSGYNPYFIWLFFVSKIGQRQISRLTTGNAQSYLNTEQIKSFTAPKITDNGLSKRYYLEICKYFDHATQFYNQAKKIFSEELGLDNIENDNFLSVVINLSEVQAGNRFDAEYFNSPCNKILAQVMKNKTTKLGDLMELTKGIEPGAGAYQDKGKLFIRVSSISKDGIIDKDQKYLSDDLYNEYKKDYQPQVGDILLTKDASIGVACVVREQVEGIVAGGVLRLKLKEKMNPEYLALVLNSVVGRLQAERDAGGSIIAHWKPEQIKNLIVPILPTSTQEKIADMVVKSHEARKKAKELLEEAKLKVEDIIEKGVSN